LNQCEEISEYYTFCDILNHNKKVIDTDEIIVPYISSDIFIVFD